MLLFQVHFTESIAICTHNARSVTISSVGVSFYKFLQIYEGLILLIKWGVINKKKSLKRHRNGNLQFVVSLLCVNKHLFKLLTERAAISRKVATQQLII